MIGAGGGGGPFATPPRPLAALAAGPLARSDLALWAAVAALAGFGLLMVHSATLGEPPHPALTGAAARQGAIAAAGAAAMLAAARFDYRLLRRLGAASWLCAAGLLLIAAAAGESAFGAQRWISVAGQTFQPAEPAKLALALALAAYAAGRAPRLPALAVTLALAAGLALPVLAQPDTGTAIVLAAIWLAAAVAWGASWRALGGLLAGLGAAGPLAFALTVPDYQRERLAVFLDPSRDPLGSGFSLRQAEAALGAGGLGGAGLFGGSESYLYGVSARSSDFMLALIGEELGLLGGLATLALFAIVGWRGFEAARRAPDAFGRLLACGLTALILSQAMLNAAVNLRLFPATGLPLPFVSQGGSALLSMFVAAGLLQSVHAQRPPTRREFDANAADLAAPGARPPPSARP